MCASEQVLPFHSMAAGFPGSSTKNRLTHSRDGLLLITSVLKAELAETNRRHTRDRRPGTCVGCVEVQGSFIHLDPSPAASSSCPYRLLIAGTLINSIKNEPGLLSNIQI